MVGRAGLHLDKRLARTRHDLACTGPELHVLESWVLEEQDLVLVPDPNHVEVVGVLPLLAPEQQPLLPGLQPCHHGQNHLQLACKFGTKFVSYTNSKC
jgi:hypothetical protein